MTRELRSLRRSAGAVSNRSAPSRRTRTDSACYGIRGFKYCSTGGCLRISGLSCGSISSMAGPVTNPAGALHAYGSSPSGALNTSGFSYGSMFAMTGGSPTKVAASSLAIPYQISPTPPIRITIRSSQPSHLGKRDSGGSRAGTSLRSERDGASVSSHTLCTSWGMAPPFCTHRPSDTLMAGCRRVVMTEAR